MGVRSASSINTRSFSIHRCLMYSIRLAAERFGSSMREERRERKKKVVIYKHDQRPTFHVSRIHREAEQ